MELPCSTCKYKTVRVNGHRTYVGCSDSERKRKHFTYDDFMYHHRCTGYVEEDICKTCALESACPMDKSEFVSISDCVHYIYVQ